jgi:hypothetical protein
MSRSAFLRIMGHGQATVEDDFSMQLIGSTDWLTEKSAPFFCS